MLKRNFAVLIVVAVVLGAGAYAWAQEAPPQAPPGENEAPNRDGRSADDAGDRHPGRRLRPLRRAVHADVTFQARDGEFRTVQIDRGKLVAVTDTSVTVERADGETVTREVDGDTRVRGAEELTQLAEGAPTLVVAEGGTALVVAQRKPDAPAA